MIKPTLKTYKIHQGTEGSVGVSRGSKTSLIYPLKPPFEFEMKFPIFKSSEKIYTATPMSIKSSLCKILQSYGKDPKFFLFASGFISGVMFDRIVFGK